MQARSARGARARRALVSVGRFPRRHGKRAEVHAELARVAEREGAAQRLAMSARWVDSGQTRNQVDEYPLHEPRRGEAALAHP